MTTHRHRLIQDALGRSPRTMLEIDVGYDFEVAIVDDDWVFRFPRRPAVEAALEIEIVLLPALAPALPVDLPSFEHVSRNPLFVGYRLIRGEPLVDEDADGVRAFLEALHAFDPSGLPVQRRDWVEAYRDQCAEFERLVLPLLDIDRRAEAERLFDDTGTLVDFKPVLLHADLGPAHLLVRDGRLAGVIDWGDARLGDPALDYALLNGPFADWDVDPDLRRRARVLPPPRTVVRGALRPVHEPAGARRARPRGDQRQALTLPRGPHTVTTIFPRACASPRYRKASALSLNS